MEGFVYVFVDCLEVERRVYTKCFLGRISIIPSFDPIELGIAAFVG